MWDGVGGPESASFKLVYPSGSSCKKKKSARNPVKTNAFKQKRRETKQVIRSKAIGHISTTYPPIYLSPSGTSRRTERSRSSRPAASHPFTHQVLHAAQRAVGTVERVGQLVHAVVGLAVAIETHSDGRAARKDKVRLNSFEKKTKKQQHYFIPQD